MAVAPNGSFQSVGRSAPGSVHDLTLLRQSDLLHRLPRAEGVMLDKGYVGATAPDGLQTPNPKDPDKDGPPPPYHLPHKARRGHLLTDEQKAFNAHLSAYRIVVEHSLAQMNQFQALAQVFTPPLRPCEQGFRHDHDRHSGLTRVVAGLVNRRQKNRPLKSYPTA